MAKSRRRDPIADYIEWTNNRYNPGHYLGGNIHPELRASTMGPKALRSAALLQIISAMVTIGLFVVAVLSGEGFSHWEWVTSLGACSLVIWVAATMYRRGRRSSPRQGKASRTNIWRLPRGSAKPDV